MASKPNKTQATEESVQEFIAAIEPQTKQQDSIKILEMMQRVTQAQPVMWGNSIVGFGDYHYKYDSGREGDFMKVGFSPRKQNLTIYIMPGFDRYPELMQQLGKHSTGKSCLYIKKMSDIDDSILEELIRESFAYMTDKYG